MWLELVYQLAVIITVVLRPGRGCIRKALDFCAVSCAGSSFSISISLTPGKVTVSLGSLRSSR